MKLSKGSSYTNPWIGLLAAAAATREEDKGGF
jgi:hypothetical protein